MDKQNVSGILLLYHHRFSATAPTIMEHINAFPTHSQFPVWPINTRLGFPQGLTGLNFKIILLHYSVMSAGSHRLNSKFLNYLEQNQSSYKIAFFQDEYHYCTHRFDFINHYNIDCVYTLIEPTYFKDTYEKYTSVPKIKYTIPGYVSDDLVSVGKSLTKPFESRSIDVGYRGRHLPFYMGQGAQEKRAIGEKFKELASGYGLKLDIETEEKKRIYRGWYRFLSDCRATLGVEAGVSIFDLEDTVRPEYERRVAANPSITFEEMSESFLSKWEDNIPYRTISPRHFEAAALRVCQILFEGKYSGLMQPMVHYIPLRKDFSNIDAVIRMYKDESLRRELTENAYRDLIETGQYSYKRFIEAFDQELLAEGFRPEISDVEVQQIQKRLDRDKKLRTILHTPFRGRGWLLRIRKHIMGV